MASKLPLAIVVLLAALLGGCVTQSQYDDLDTKYRASQQLLEETRGQLKSMAEVTAELREQLSARNRALEEISLALQSASAVAADRDVLASERERLLDNLDQLTSENMRISSELDEAFARLGRMRGIEYERGSGRLRLGSEILFASGEAELSSGGQQVLAEVASALCDANPASVRIEGHTDSDPVSKTSVRWKRGNWDLSATRALEVLVFLRDEGRVPESMLNVAGYGPYRPVASNDTVEGKRRNRRVEIFVEGAVDRAQ